MGYKATTNPLLTTWLPTTTAMFGSRGQELSQQPLDIAKDLPPKHSLVKRGKKDKTKQKASGKQKVLDT